MAPLDNENENPQTHITNEPPADGSLSSSEALNPIPNPLTGEMPPGRPRTLRHLHLQTPRKTYIIR